MIDFLLSLGIEGVTGAWIPLAIAGAGLVGSMFGGSDKPRPTVSTTSGTSATRIDPASQAYLDQFLRPLSQQAAGQISGAPRLPGADPALNQAIGGLGTAYAGPGMASGGEIGNLPLLTQMLAAGGGSGGGGGFSFGGGGGGGASFDPRQLDINRISQFFNPYQNEVIGATQGDFDRQRGVNTSRAASQATADGAFGGSRAAVLEAMGARDIGNTESSTLANLRKSGYDTATQMAMQEFLQGEQGRAQVGAASASASGTSSAASISANQRMHEAMLQMQMNAGQFDISNEFARRQNNQQYGLDAYRANTGFQQDANRIDLARLGQLGQFGNDRRDADVQSQQDYVNRWLQAVQAGATGLGPTGSNTTTSGTTRTTGGGTQFNPWEAVMGAGLTAYGAG